MNLLSPQAIRDFIQKYPEAEQTMRVWYNDLRKLEPENFAHWNSLYEAQVRPIHCQADYEIMIDFLCELIRTQNVDQEPYKSLWATAAHFAADWEKQHDFWVSEPEIVKS